ITSLSLGIMNLDHYRLTRPSATLLSLAYAGNRSLETGGNSQKPAISGPLCECQEQLLCAPGCLARAREFRRPRPAEWLREHVRPNFPANFNDHIGGNVVSSCRGPNSFRIRRLIEAIGFFLVGAEEREGPLHAWLIIDQIDFSTPSLVRSSCSANSLST